MRFSLAVVILASCVTLAPAQFGPLAGPGGTITSVPSAPAPYSGVRPVYGGGYYPGYGGNYIESPVSGYFNGIANLTSAYGQYGKDYQQSRLLNQDVERSKLASRRAVIEQQMWEQSLQPTAEDLRRQRRELELRNAYNDPPLSDIISGKSLNTLFSQVKELQAKGGYGPTVPIDQDMLKHINLTVTPGQNVALFKDGGKLKWPFALRDTPFDKEREQITDLVGKAVKEASTDELAPPTLRSLKGAVRALDKKIQMLGPDMSIPDTIQAQHYVTELNEAVNAIQHPSASNYLNKKWTAQGRSMGDLVMYMTNNGLQFAPALPGEEGQYRALYSSLLSYSHGAQQSARR